MRDIPLRAEQVTVPDTGEPETLRAPANAEPVSADLLEMARVMPDVNAAGRLLLIEVAHALRERPVIGSEAHWVLSVQEESGQMKWWKR